MTTNSSVSRPLEGIRVLDLTVALSGPYCSLLLAGMGAEVIRIESPDGGDIARTNPPFFGQSGIHFGKAEAGDVSLTLLNRGRNKRSVTLDLKTEPGRRIFTDLAAKVDVVIENLSDGAAQRLGVGYADIAAVNPAIIYASIKAFGEPSAYSGTKGMDIIVQAVSGIMDVTGFPDGPPTRFGLPIADLVAPLYASNGILAALIQRGRTGKGQHIEVSMLDCLASLVAEEHFDVFSAAGYSLRSGNMLDRLAPFGLYETADGYVAIVAFSPDWMRSLCRLMGRSDIVDDARFSTRGPRMKHAGELNALISEWTTSHPTSDIVELLKANGVPCAPVRSALEVLADPDLRARGAVTELEHPQWGGIGVTGMGLPIRFSSAHAAFDQPADELGASTEAVLSELLGMDEAAIGALRAERII